MTTSLFTGYPAGTTTAPRSTYLALWFGFLGGPLAWTINELASFVLVTHACYPNMVPRYTPLSGKAWPAAVAIAAAMLLMALCALVVSVRGTRRLIGKHDYGITSADSHRTTAKAYIAFSGILFSVIFGLLVAYNLVGLIFEPICAI